MGVPKDAPAKAPEPSRLEVLRAKFAELQARIPDLKLETVAPDPDPENGSKGYTLAKWGRTRVAQVVEPPHTPESAERAVLEVVIAHLTVS